MDALKTIAAASMKESFPEFNVGDTVKVSVNIREGERERIQMFEGTVIAKKGSGVAETFTVRRVFLRCWYRKSIPSTLTKRCWR